MVTANKALAGGELPGWRALQAATAHGGRYGDSATVGGAVSTDAGGLLAVRYGTARSRVAGLEAVLGDGTVISRMHGLLKDNAGLNLPALLVGSEGTLGIVTAVRWKLVPQLHQRITALVPLDSVDAAVTLLEELRVNVPSLEAAEEGWPSCWAV